MQVKTGGRIYQEAPARAEPADSVVTDFYAQLPQIRMTGTSTAHRMRSSPKSLRNAPSRSQASDAVKPACETLLPRMPLSAHLRDRERN